MDSKHKELPMVDLQTKLDEMQDKIDLLSQIVEIDNKLILHKLDTIENFYHSSKDMDNKI